MTPDDEDEGRPRGILSPADRDYLTAPETYAEEYSRQSVNERKEAIRQRMRDAVLDFSLLIEHLPPAERQEVFGKHGFLSHGESWEELGRLNVLDQLERGITAGVAFLYLAARDTGANQEKVVEGGVKRGEEELYPGYAEVDLDVERQERQKWMITGRNKMDRGEQLENAEIRALLESESVDDERVGAYIRGVNDE